MSKIIMLLPTSATRALSDFITKGMDLYEISDVLNISVMITVLEDIKVYQNDNDSPLTWLNTMKLLKVTVYDDRFLKYLDKLANDEIDILHSLQDMDDWNISVIIPDIIKLHKE